MAGILVEQFTNILSLREAPLFIAVCWLAAVSPAVGLLGLTTRRWQGALLSLAAVTLFIPFTLTVAVRLTPLALLALIMGLADPSVLLYALPGLSPLFVLLMQGRLILRLAQRYDGPLLYLPLCGVVAILAAVLLAAKVAFLVTLDIFGRP